ncbi:MULTISPECIES: DUF4167 domain-containing protein [Sphingomonas]|uniref:DUF4167 domain-containing protein n=1 Tax=Sphingomonas TaxID=13687 RepID=UPI001AED90A2|nr:MULTISPECIES: DUF4167 domain-containing protein [Sphingomonas]
MINNRQNGRRRGRGGGGNNNGPRQGGGGQGRPDNGNRIDSRARGNANQLLEKYKNLAAEAQRQGDRINTEYYLQFADHYFRVLADQRGRFEDQQPRRQQPFDLDGDDEFGDEGEPIRVGEQDGGEFRQTERGFDENRQQRRRERGNDRGEQRGNEGETRQGRNWDERRPRRAEAAADPSADERPVEVAGQHRAEPFAEGETPEARSEAVIAADAPAAPRRRGRPRRDAQVEAAQAEGESNGVDADRLPPSLTLVANDADDAPKPRRRRTTRAVEAPAAE